MYIRTCIRSLCTHTHAQLLNGGSEMEQRLGELSAWEQAADEALAASQQRAQHAQQRIRELEEQRQNMQDKMADTQEALKNISKQLKKSYAAYLARKAEVADLNSMFQVCVDVCVNVCGYVWTRTSPIHHQCT